MFIDVPLPSGNFLHSYFSISRFSSLIYLIKIVMFYNVGKTIIQITMK